MTIVVTTSETDERSLAALRDDLQAKGYARDTAPEVQNRAINSVYRRVIGMRRWPFLINGTAPSLVADSDVSVIPLTYQDVLVWGAIAELCFRERDTDGHTIATAQFDARLSDMLNEFPPDVTLTGGEANSLGVIRDQVRAKVFASEIKGYDTDTPATVIDQVINSVYRRVIGMRRWPFLISGTAPPLEQDADESVIPLNYQDVLVWGAVAELSYRVRDFEGYGFATTEFDKRLDDMLNEFPPDVTVTQEDEASLAAIRDRVRAKIFASEVKGYDTDTPAPVIDQSINSVYRRVVGMRRWPFLEVDTDSTLTLTVGNGSVSMSTITDLLHVDAVRLLFGTEFIDLDHEPVQQHFRTYAHLDRENGVPRLWTKIGNTLRFWPRPNRAYTVALDYSKFPPSLTADGDIPVIPLTYQDVLVWGAVSELAYRVQDYQGQQAAIGELEKRLIDMLNEYGLRQRQTSSSVVATGIWDDMNWHPGGGALWPSS